MTPEITEPSVDKPRAKAPAKKRRKHARKVAKPSTEAKANDELAGLTAKDCPAACTVDRCVISTVGVCHHPFKTAPNGAGPLTLANREKARKRIKHQIIDMKG
jgi:hypothetical protein